MYLWSSFAHYALRALLRRRIRRDAVVVTNEYGNVRNEYWKSALSVDELIHGDSSALTWVMLNDRVVRGTQHDVRALLLPRLRDRVAGYSKPGDLIVEFGAGTGRNLAYLARALPDRRYLGLELTPRTVDDARRLFGELGIPVEMRVADVTQPVQLDTPAAVAYSVLALEQLPRTVSRDALRQMTVAARNAVVCLEPIRELYPYSIRGITSRLRQYCADYLSGLSSHAREMGFEPRVEARTGLAQHALNEICELVIELS